MENFDINQEALLPQEEVLELKKKHKNLTIGIPKELEKLENRIVLAPEAVQMLVNEGNKIIIESDAGKNANYTDHDYVKAGAQITNNNKEIFKSDIILKIAPLLSNEIDYLTEKQTVISSIHVTQQNSKEVEIRKLIQKKVTAIAFEYLKDDDNHYPVVQSMSEISGSTSILIAAEYLSNVHDGKGVFLGGIAGITPTEVVILGAGTASEYAARTALGLGAFVKVFDNSINRLRKLQTNLSQRIFTSVFHPQTLKKAFKSADVVIGALKLENDYSKYIISEKLVQSMKPGSVIIDMSIDQGGSFETSQLTTHSSPVFRKHNVVHYCVPNIASRVARTASISLSNIFAPIIMDISKAGSIQQILKDNMGIRHGVYIYNGYLTSNYSGNNFGIAIKDINLLMAAF